MWLWRDTHPQESEREEESEKDGMRSNYLPKNILNSSLQA